MASSEVVFEAPSIARAPNARDRDLESVRWRTGIATVTVAGVLCAAAVGVLFSSRPGLSLLACAGMLGWLNLSAGPCAQNALTALTPLAMASSKRTWFKAMLAYTLAGLISSVTTGALLGAVGGLAGFNGASSAAAALIVGSLAFYTLLREGLEIPLPLPQMKRSSRQAFARLGQPTAAVLWGIDVGCFFSTWLTYAGAWWLVAVGVCSGDASFAAALFGAHWLGRSALVWFGRWIIPDPNQGHRLPAVWHTLHPAFRRLYAGVVLGGTMLLAMT